MKPARQDSLKKLSSSKRGLQAAVLRSKKQYLDFILLMDSSGSIGSNNFDKAKDATMVSKKEANEMWRFGRTFLA